MLGFDRGFWFVYAAALVAVLFGRITRNRGVGAIAAAALGSSLSFFLITNFMVWATGRMYPITLAGLAACFTAAHSLLPESIRGRRVLHSGAFRRLRAAEALVPSGSTRPLSVRVVSLLAGATEMVCALGAGETLVGRSHECDNPSWVRQLPSCSQPAFDISVSSGEIDAEVRRRLHAGEPLYHIDMELIRELQPDLVITQSHCDVCAVTPADLERGGCAHRRAPTVAIGRDDRGNLPEHRCRSPKRSGFLNERPPSSIASGSV